MKAAEGDERKSGLGQESSRGREERERERARARARARERESQVRMGSRARADVVGVRRSEESGVTRADNMGCMRQREGEMYSTTWGSETKRVSRTSHQPFRRQSFMPGCL